LLGEVERGRVVQALFREVPVSGLGDELLLLSHLGDEFTNAHRVYRGVW